MRFSDLPGLIGRTLVVEIDSTVDTEPTVHVQGALLAISEEGLVLEVKGSATIIMKSSIVDIQNGVVDRKLVRRKIKFVPPERIRQHLLDRHAVPWDIAKLMTAATAQRVHDGVNHLLLGHRHEEGGVEE